MMDLYARVHWFKFMQRQCLSLLYLNFFSLLTVADKTGQVLDRYHGHQYL